MFELNLPRKVVISGVFNFPEQLNGVKTVTMNLPGEAPREFFVTGMKRSTDGNWSIETMEILK